MTQERTGHAESVNRKPRLREKERREEAIGGEGLPSKNRKSTGSEIHEPQPNTTEMSDDRYAAGASGRATRRGSDEHSHEKASNDRKAGNKERASGAGRGDKD